jgi:hypothetical protein
MSTEPRAEPERERSTQGAGDGTYMMNKASQALLLVASPSAVLKLERSESQEDCWRGQDASSKLRAWALFSLSAKPLDTFGSRMTRVWPPRYRTISAPFAPGRFLPGSALGSVDMGHLIATRSDKQQGGERTNKFDPTCHSALKYVCTTLSY